MPDRRKDSITYVENRAILADKAMNCLIECLMDMPDCVPAKPPEPITDADKQEFIAWLNDITDTQCDAATEEGRFEEFLEEFLVEFRARLDRRRRKIKGK
jgi:hypothetical protein